MITKQEAEKFLGQEVAVTFDEDDDEFIGVKGVLTAVTDDSIELDDNEDDLCLWKFSEIGGIEPLSGDWNQPFAWIKHVR